MALAERLVGTWSLDSYVVFEEDGVQRAPLGPAPAGLLIYAGDGFMAAQLTRPHGLVPAYIAYCGTYDVDPDGARIVHHVTASIVKEWIGRDLARTLRLSDDLLMLGARVAEPDGTATRHELTWRRAVRARTP
jgi:hypothetical protein